MHFETLNCFVVLNDWVKRFFLKFLPIFAQIVFGVRIKEKQKILNI